MSRSASGSSVVALSGGVGGAKLVLGLYKVLPANTLCVIANTGDDFDHLGLRICPDVDTTLYTLADRANPELGWGRREETWTFMSVLAQLGGETWFRLGDGDLALHVERTRRLAAGQTLGAIVEAIAARFGLSAKIVPMSDEAVRTRVHTNEGEIGFQDYFVRLKCEPAVRAISFAGASHARTSSGARAVLTSGSVSSIIICPSNPYLSIDPILAVPDMRELLRAAGAPIVAVTPLIGGEAVKGPTAKIMEELGIERSPGAVARHYEGLIDGFVLDSRDRHLESKIGVPCLVTNTLMKTIEDRQRLARQTFDFAASLAQTGKR